MKLVVVHSLWPQEPLFDEEFQASLQQGLSSVLFANAKIWGPVRPKFEELRGRTETMSTSLPSPMALAKWCSQAGRQLGLNLGIALNQDPHQDLRLRGKGMGAPPIQPSPFVTFPSLNHKSLSTWLRHSEVDVTLLLGPTETPKLNLLTSTRAVFQLSLERESSRNLRRSERLVLTRFSHADEEGSAHNRLMHRLEVDRLEVERDPFNALTSRRLGHVALSLLKDYGICSPEREPPPVSGYGGSGPSGDSGHEAKGADKLKTKSRP